MSIFSLKRKDYNIILLLSLMAAALYFINNAYITFAFAVMLSIIFLIKRNYGACIATYIMIGSFITVATLLVVYLSFLCLFLLIKNSYRVKTTTFIATLTTITIMIVSYLLGYQSEINILILAVLALFLYLGIRENSSEGLNSYIVVAYIAYGIVILSIVLIQFALGQTVFRYGRLSYDSSIRSLANACVVPLFFIMTSFVSGKRMLNARTPWMAIITIALFGGLMATLSRGAIIALVVSILVAFILTKNIGSKFVKIIIVGGLAAAVYFLLLNDSVFHLDRLFIDEGGGFNGRTEIWTFYWKKMTDGGLIHILFGLGPGDIKRLSGSMQMYSHSTYFDIVFSYGLVGGIIMLLALGRIVYKVVKTRSPVLISVLAGLLTNYFSHGTVANYMLYVVLAALIGSAELIDNQAKDLLQSKAIAEKDDKKNSFRYGGIL